MKSPTVRSRVLLLLLLVLPGCSWIPFFGGGDDDEVDRLEPVDLVDFEPEADVRRLWRQSVGEGLGRKFLMLEPVVVADRVVAADAYGRVEAFDRFSGRRLWRTSIGEPDDGGFFAGLNFFDRRDPSFVTGGLGAGGGRIYAGTTGGDVVALEAASGDEAWRINVGSEVLAPPTYGRGLVFVQTIDGRLVALEDDGSAIRWSYDNQVPVLTLRGTARPVFSDDVVYAGFANGNLAAVRADNGEPIWQERVMLPQGRSELDRIVDVDGAPLVSGAIVYAASFQGRLRAFRRADGQAFWEKEASSYHNLVEGYGQVYLVDEDAHVTAIDQGSADVAWKQESLHRRGLSSPFAFSNYVVVGDRNGYLHVLAQSDGRFLARRKIDGDGLRSPMAYADGTLYVLGNSGALTALEIQVK